MLFRSNYNFSTKPLLGKVLPDKSMYVVVMGYAKMFPSNLETLNMFLTKHKVPTIELGTLEGLNQYVLTLDPYYLKSTYNISLITLLIRFTNTEQPLKDILHLNENTIPYADQSKWNRIKKKDMWFNLKKDLNSEYFYWTGIGGNYNSKQGSFAPEIVHNNGIMNWYDSMEVHDV